MSWRSVTILDSLLWKTKLNCKAWYQALILPREIGKCKFSNSKPVDGSDDIVDEVGSLIGESIPESIEGSGKIANNLYEDFKANQYKLASEDNGALNNLIS